MAVKNTDTQTDFVAEDSKPVKLDMRDITKDKKVNLTDDTLINVRSNRVGQLIYKDKSGNKLLWENLGAVQEMTIRELREMKTIHPRFFGEQFVVITGVTDTNECDAKPADIYKLLNISKFYTSYIDPRDHGQFVFMKPQEFEQRVSMLSKSAKENLVVALNGFIRNGLIDSLKKIKQFETALGCKLTKPQ